MKMIKQEWKEEYKNLEKLYEDYVLAYHEYKNGSNSAKRKKGENALDSCRILIKSHIENNEDIFKLFTGSEDMDVNASIIYSELIVPWNLGGELSKLLVKMQAKINDFE